MKYIGVAFYLSVVALAVLLDAKDYRLLFDILGSPRYFFEDGWFILRTSLFLTLLVAYLAWLMGGAAFGWKIPLPVHGVPIAVLALSMAGNGMLVAGVGDVSGRGGARKVRTLPSDRTMAALAAVKARAEKGQDCGEILKMDFASGLADGGFTGYRSHGLPVDFHVDRRAGSAPVQSIAPTDSLQAHPEPGTLYLVCDEGRGAFYLTAVVTDQIPTGKPTFLVDGVGNPVTLEGRAKASNR